MEAASFEASQVSDAMQRSCNIFLAASDCDWMHGSSGNKERLTVVSTLMLVASTYSFGLWLPTESADFLTGLFYLSLSNSCVHFLLGLFSCISASILARTSQKVLLNNCVRPPFEEMIMAVDEGEHKESAEHFERQGVSALLRIPGAHFLESRFGRELLKLRGMRLNRLQVLWDDLAMYAPYYLSWGVRNLLLAFASLGLALVFAGEVASPQLGQRSWCSRDVGIPPVA
eukprot:g7927.t1